MVGTSGGWLLGTGSWLSAIGYWPSLQRGSRRSGLTHAPPRVLRLPFRLATRELFDFALFRSAGIVAGFLRLFGLRLLASGAFGFLAFLFG